MTLWKLCTRVICTAILGMAFSATDTVAQGLLASAGSPNLAPLDGPPAPVAPEVIARDEEGRATVRAVRLQSPLTIDGRLDESVYRTVPAAGGFIQQEPLEGESATEKTDFWILFDDRNFYIVARCWESEPDRWVVNELQRDGDVTNNENLSVQLDTFYDHRNGFMFQTSPIGAIRDVAFTDEGNLNVSWNAVWDVRTSRFDGGWTMEMVIPFKSIRYATSGPQMWGINFRRIVKWKNETSHLTAVPRSYGFNGAFRASAFGTLVGLETPPQAMNLDLKPYATSAVNTDRRATVPYRNDFTPNGGLDLKYGVTRGLTADLTYNTDFAQVEDDVQQVNLTRFSLFFPEKREFFLEGQGIFGFGGVQIDRGGGNNDIPILFFSRRIGLSQGQAVPVIGGGRLTGRMDKFSIGALSIRTDDKLSAKAVGTTFSVLRVKRDILRRSNIGVLATHRSSGLTGAGSNATLGVDANMQFFGNLSVIGSYAQTETPGLRGDVGSYRGRFDYNGDRYGIWVEQVMVGSNFNSEVGFTPRTDFLRDSAQLRFSPRPRSSRIVRRYNFQGNFEYITDAAGRTLEDREARGSFRIELQNSDQWNIGFRRVYERLPETFEIASGVTLPAGPYEYQFLNTDYNFGQQRAISGRLNFTRGTFYNGHRTELGWSNGKVNLSPHFSVDPGVTLNWIDLPQGRFTNRLFNARAVVMPGPRIAIGSLIQFNATARTFSTNTRFRWEYSPGSELFVVYSEGRDTSVEGPPELMNRSFVVKITRLLRF